MSTFFIAHGFVKSDADRVRIGDTGAGIDYVLTAKNILQMCIEDSPHTLMLILRVQINTGFYRPAVGCLNFKRGSVGISNHDSIFHGCKPGMKKGDAVYLFYESFW